MDVAGPQPAFVLGFGAAGPQPDAEAVREAIREAQKKMRANGWKSAAEAATERRLRLNGRTAKNG
jgi:hypothetical protein